MEWVEQDSLPLQDESDPQEESPYLRRQQSIHVRRSRISRRVRLALFVIGVLVPVGFAGYGLAMFALTSPFFVLTSPEDIVLVGNHFVSREEVLGALALPLTRNLKAGTNVFRMSLDVRRQGVETLPWVRAASVTRILPHGLLVHITERTPVAYANVGGRVSLVDDDGMLLEKPDNGVFDFPVLYGLESLSGIDERRARLALYREFMRQLGEEGPHSGWVISEVYLTDAEDLKALLINGQQTVQVHFGQKDFLPRFRNFLALLPEIQKSNDKLDSVDLRYRNQIVVDPPMPAPAAEKAVAAGSEGKE
ncbi:MAG TPA: FtsQ-type POTRA domain-containing protein [Terriglobia bacterium]|nr:FtsQ-type POTRA domain-containing protein [Terriglobia bacterium]